jgi:Asp-tRNA(Asn)/Glu-tRNA(Gln) amidotransferase A subunit family amidase
LQKVAAEPLDVPPEQWATPCPSYPDHLGRRAFLGVVVDAMDRAHVDAVVYPTFTRMPTHLIKIEVAEGGGDPGEFIAPATGQPAITVPMGFSMDELPVGLELLGRPFGEGQLFALAYAYEQATHHRRPPPAFEPRFVPGCLGDRTVAPSVGGE